MEREAPIPGLRGGILLVRYLMHLAPVLCAVGRIVYGSGTDLVPNNLDFSDLKPSNATNYLLYVFLASAYEF